MVPLLSPEVLVQADDKGMVTVCPQKKIELVRQGLGVDDWRHEPGLSIRVSI